MPQGQRRGLVSDREMPSATLLDEEELSAMTDPELLAYEPEQVGVHGAIHVPAGNS